jgi:drug/metabolite transporter (DMT)-like permease
MAFFFRAWHWPDPADFHLFAIIGVGIAGAGYLISQAYRLAEAAYVAPFEYLALPLSILWGVLIFDDALDPITLTGAALIIASGLFTVWREHRAGQAAHAPKTRR